MRKSVVLAAVAMLTFACGVARGDGMFVLPSDSLKHFTEQTQLAVVEVRSDRTVSVDLFISLLSSSQRAEEAPFLLPLQTMPGEFAIDETTLADFREAHLDRLHKVLDKAARLEESADKTPRRMFGTCSLLAGPCAAAVGVGVFMVTDLRQHMGEEASLGAVAPALSVATEHARADVYPALKEQELATLAGMSGLPDLIAKALKGYVGRPFALVRLRMEPPPRARAKESGVAPKHHPGVHFRFTQRTVKAKAPPGEIEPGYPVYDYPLGTGSGWQHPIPETRVYVTAGYEVGIDVTFPPYQRFSSGGHAYQMHPYVDSGAARGRQVLVATYEDAKPDKDVRIEVLPPHRYPWGLASREKGLRMRVVTARIAFPALALFAWLVAFFAVVWHDPHAKSKGLWGAMWRSWAAAQAMLLLPLGAIAVLGLSVESIGDLLWEGTLGPLALWPSLAIVLAATAIVTLAVTRFVAPAGRGFLWRSAAASLIGAAVYVGAGCGVLISLMIE